MTQPERLGTAQWANPDEFAERHAFREGAFWLGRTMPGQKPVGVNDDRHICLVAGTRSGKGTSIILPNLLLWPGSIVVVDPTGDNATITAARRGQGDAKCPGLGQAVYVLDPYGISKVDPKYRASFNPLDLLDPSSKGVVRDAERIASSLIPPSREEEPWAQNGARRLLTGLILHVLTWYEFEGRRTLVTVRDLVYRGDHLAKKQLAEKGEDSGLSAFELLWLAMKSNDSFNGQVAGAGEEFERVSRTAPPQWSGVHDVALSATNFINNDDMRACLARSDFSARDLKTSARGVSVYLTIPAKDRVEDFRWLRLIISLVMTEMEALPDRPASGHPVLMVLDEFAGLQKMDRIESGISEIAKYGVKLMLVLQSLAQLKTVYGENWETFLANCGTKVFFGIEDPFTQEFVSKLIGETQIELVEQSVGASVNHSRSTTSTTGESSFSQSGEGRSRSDSYKRAALGLRDTAGLFRKLSGNVSASDSREISTASGRSSESSRAEANQEGHSSERSWNQRIQKRPLVTPDEVRRLFRRIEESEKSDLYPGMAIGILASHSDPVLFRRTTYFDDEYFGEFGFGRPRPKPVPTLKPPAEEAPYVAGSIALPFDSLVIKILHDQLTAVIGGVDGRIAAIDLRTGAVLATTQAEEATGRRSRPGCGEIHYLADSYFFLELASQRQSFYTMSHSGVLKTWIFDGTFRQLTSVALVTPHFETLRAKILKAKRSSGWSTWTCYSQEVPDTVPCGIVDAKLSADGSSIVCLTEWFAVYRCDLAGQLRDEPIVLGDAFAIEPANPDGSEVWVGRGSMGNSLHRVVFGRGVTNGVGVPATFGMYGIHPLSSGAMYAGGAVVRLPSIASFDGSDFWVASGLRPLVLPEIRRVLGPAGSMIQVYDLETMRREGEPLMAGHSNDVRGVDATKDRRYAVSIDDRSLRIWNLVTRAPLGGFPPEKSFLRHGLQGNAVPVYGTSDHKVYYHSYRNAGAVFDLHERSFVRITSSLEEIGAATVGDEVHLLSLQKRAGPPPPGAKGLLGKLLKVPPPNQYFLRHHVISSGQPVDRASVLLNGRQSHIGYCEPLPQNSIAVDLGHGRVALLTAGHLALYDLNTRAIVAGPIDISGPADGVNQGDGTWIYYTQLATSPDGTKLFARGEKRPIKVFSAINLSPLVVIQGSEGRVGFLLPWVDSRHVLFSTRIRSRDYKTQDILAIADASTGKMLGQLCNVNSFPPEAPHRAVFLAGGTILAVVDYGKHVRLLDLAQDKVEQEALGAHADSISSVHLCPERNALMTASQDGTARFWTLDARLAPRPAEPTALLARVQPVEPGSIDLG